MSGRTRVAGDPSADASAIIAGDRWRITVLTAGLVRIEWSDVGVFEDRASTFAVNRQLPVPPFEVRPFETRGATTRLDLLTDLLHLEYNGEPFSASGLMLTVRSGMGMDHTSVWRYGQPADGLGGTARTLDEADGAVPLGGGVVSPRGYAVLDDSASFLIEADGTPASRRPGNRDLYLFVHGHDYRQAVRDLYAISGPVPVLPRWALGNWWSRYHPYSDSEYVELLDAFDAERVPFAVAVLDMDWHHVAIDPRFGTGWTGYSWNRELFPDPPGFLRQLHERGLRVTLNVHPADGIRAYEDAYPQLAEAVGIDPASEQPVSFDPTDPTFLDGYFRLVHHPLEADGVDFWWLDWQQGAHTRIAGVDPLWLLNIAHFNDSGRDGRQPLTFSRYAGPGSHRYPIGFSGDTIITWESLDFQPYFTATASNIGYGWWSHDIGGHMFGGRDDELTVRWMQLGVFSPIMRLHSSQHPFIRKEPWAYPAESRAVIGRFLRLRHRLLPYLHTMNARAAYDGAPLVEPMYWEHPDAAEAYRTPNQFRFGTELVVAPITSPRHAVLRLASTKAWLPAGYWTDLFTGTAYRGDREVRLHRPLHTLPVLLREGGLLPLAGSDDDEALGTDLPRHLELVLAPGADGRFDLREEDGRDAEGGPDQGWAITTLSYDEGAGILRIAPAAGNVGCLPASRRWSLTLLGATGRAERVPLAGGRRVELAGTATTPGTWFDLGEIETDAEAEIQLIDVARRGWPATVEALFGVLDRCQLSYDTKLIAYEAVRSADGAPEAAARVQGLELGRDVESALLELILADYTQLA